MSKIKVLSPFGPKIAKLKLPKNLKFRKFSKDLLKEKFDLIVIGGGPGGYVCAIRAAQLGLKSACVESRGKLGGTCLNVGCIPSKSLLDSSHHYEEAVKNFNTHGIEISGEIKVNLKKMIDRKQSVVDQTTKGINYLMDKNKIDVFNGLGSFEDSTHIFLKQNLL